MSILKKGFVILVLVAGGLYLAAPSLLGFSLAHLPTAIKVSTSMGAKLGCSAYFISNYSPQRILDDLATYSPVNSQLNLQYDPQHKMVTASLLGMAETQAQYRPSSGCTLVMGNDTVLNGLSLPDKLEVSDHLAWPQGRQVSLDPRLQKKAESMFAQDNQQGLDTRALVVVKVGKLVAEVYSAEVDAYTPILGWSMGKSVTAMLLARWQMVHSLDMSRDMLFENWKDDERRHIRIRDLLHMTSGLDFDETYAPGSDATKMLFLTENASDVPIQAPLQYKAGSHFSYSSGTTNLLSRWLFEQQGSDPQQHLNFLYQQFFCAIISV